ncbi:MAG: Ig-like domain repeat protein [Rudaea sp.]|nr:Ig-like domain repeat protein [Rudaea sp.]
MKFLTGGIRVRVQRGIDLNAARAVAGRVHRKCRVIGAQFLGLSGDESKSRKAPCRLTIGRFIVLRCAALVALLIFGTAPAFAATLTVSNLNDSGTGSLRAQIAAAAGGDTIVFQNGLSGTITLASTLSIGRSLTIAGPGAANLTVSGNSAVRVFYVASNVLVTFSGLTVANGVDDSSQGAGLLNNGTVNLVDCVFSGNKGSTNGRGGGVTSFGPLSVNRCRFTNNSAKIAGGAIELDSDSGIILDSLFDSNSADQYGGGAIITFIPTTIRNTTFSANYTNGNSGGGAINVQGSAAVVTENSTFAGNSAPAPGGAIWLGKGTLKVTATAFSNNTSTGGGGIYVLQGQGASFDTANSKYNLFYANKSNGAEDDNTGYGTSNYFYTTTAPFAALAGNGGPTPTLMPVVGGAAIDAVPSASCTANDQRGVVRPQTVAGYTGSTPCDIGAVEVRRVAYTLGVSVVGAGSVSGTPTPSGAGSGGNISACTSASGAACSAIYFGENNISSVTLTAAAPANGYALVWSGTGCTRTPASPLVATVTMDQNRACTATYYTLALATANLPNGTYGSAYSASIPAATGGFNPYTYTIGSGALPPGLSLNGSTGAVTGMPGAASATPYAFTVTAVDTNNASTSQSYSITIAKAVLSVKAIDTSRTFGAPDPTFSASYTGFMPGDTAANSLTVMPTFTTNATSASPPGTGYTITAAGAASAKYAPAYQNGSLTITSASSATALMQSLPAGSVYGQSVVFTATATNTSAGSTAVPNGTVSFGEGGIALSGCSAVPLDGTGKAQCQTASLAVGSHSVTASYAPANTNFTGSASGAVTQSVAKAATTTAVTSPGAITLGSPVTVNAQVTVTSPGSGTPTGTITIGDGGAQAGDNCTISLPATSCVLTPSTAGTKTLTAQYNGDGSFGASTAPSGSLVVNPSQPGTALTSSANPSVFGQSATLTATITPAAGGAIPTGAVTFCDGATSATDANCAGGTKLCAAVNVAAGSGSASAVCTVSTFGVATHSLSAVYAGDGNNQPSNATLNQIVNAADTTTTLTPPSAINLGDSLTVQVSVAAKAPGTGTPAGSVTIHDGSASCSAALSNGAGSCTLTPPAPAGTHNLSATYTATADFATSMGSAILTVNAAPAGTIVTSSANPSLFSHSVTFMATVTPAAGNPTPTGHVDFSDGGTALSGCTGLPLSGGAATCAASTLAVGSHTIQASYSGDTNNLPSSGTLTQTVGKDTTTLSLSANPHPAGAIQPIT